MFRALTQLSGFEIHSHSVRGHGGGGGDLGGGGGFRRHNNELSGNGIEEPPGASSRDDRSPSSSSSTDVFLFALDEDNLVETDRMIRCGEKANCVQNQRSVKKNFNSSIESKKII